MEVFNLNIIPGAVAPIIHASQYDEDREFRANLFEGDQVFELTGAEDISVNVRKTDGNVVTAAVVNTGANYVDFSTTLQMTACAGANLCQLRIENSPRKIGTLNFILAVERDPLEGGIQSESEINNLETQVAGMVAEDVAEQYDSANVIFDNEPTSGHGTPYTVTSEGIKTAIDNAFDYDNTASGSIAHITDGADNIPVKSLVSEIVAVETGNGQPKSPDNPYIISGFDNGVITRCGKNLFDNSLMVNSQTVVVGDTVTLTATGNFQGSAYAYMPVKQGYKYALSWETRTSGSAIEVRRYNASGTVTNTIVITQSTIINIDDGTTVKISIVYGNRTAGAGTFVLKGFNIALGEDYQSYEPYNGNNYTFTFGQTVYGGHFDNKGNFVITHGIKTFNGASSESWSEYPSYNGFYIAITDMNIGTRQDGWANRFLTTYDSSHTSNSCWFGVNSNRLFILECSGTTGGTVADLKTWLANNNLTVKYPLATPITLAITSQDIPTLLGENNIFSNCGDVEVEYYTSKSNDILDFIDSEIGKKNGTNIPIEENSQDSIKDYVDNGLSGKADSTDLPFVKYKEIDVTFDASGEGTLFNSVKFVVALKDIPSDQLYVGYVSYIAGSTIKVKALSRTAIAFSSQSNVSSTRKVGVYYLDNIATQ